jgi:DNA-binding NtrC family response regulator
MSMYSPGIQHSSSELEGAARNIPLTQKKFAPSVLVVDDDALMRWSLAELLGDLEYAVTESGDARSAVSAVDNAAKPFDVVLLDYSLPDSADLRLLEIIRRLSPTSRVIMMTAYNSPELVQGAVALGAYRVITKPFEVDSIATLVGEARADRG